MLIAYPMEWKSKTVSSEKGGRFEQLFDRKNSSTILDKKHREMLDYIKRISNE
jgi:hypothetical protein